MHSSDLQQRLSTFCSAHYPRAVRVFDVLTMPGHAGFSWGFRVEHREGIDSWYLRLPPPNVQWTGTADVLRQVAVLQALEGTAVPHCSVRWSGSDERWFGCPYFIVPWLEGDVLRFGPGEWGAALPRRTQLDFARQAMHALAELHRIPATRAPYLGEPLDLGQDVIRWDRFVDKAADAHRLASVPLVRLRLLEKLPAKARIGIFHGDFQVGNLFASPEARLLAIIDWELAGIGATLNDVGWICCFSDPAAWVDDTGLTQFLDPDTLVSLYEEAIGEALPDIAWYRALAAYKFAIISGFNLALHRRGKRHDPMWERFALSMESLLARALELLP